MSTLPNLVKRIYLDHSATAPLRQAVLEEMLPYFSQDFGNPSSLYRYGQAATARVRRERRYLAEILNCTSQEVVFTSGGTESINLALRGIALAAKHDAGKTHIITTGIEHAAVSATIAQLCEYFGFTSSSLPCDRFGRVFPADLEAAIGANVGKTALISCSYASSEVGTIQDVAALTQVAQEQGIPVHLDAVQAAAHLPLDTQALGVDALSISAHKLGGPKGVGALYLKKEVPILPILTGGSQERSRRAGTENVAGIVGLGAALRLARGEDSASMAARNQVFIADMLENIPCSILVGHPEQRLPFHAAFILEGVRSERMIIALDTAGISVSAGSACNVGSTLPNPALRALGFSSEQAQCVLRFTQNHATSPEDLEHTAAHTAEAYMRLHQSHSSAL